MNRRSFQFISSLTFNVFVFSLLSLVLVSCSIAANEKKELELTAEKSIAKDVKSISIKCIDNLSAGLGSILLDFSLSKQDQDSLLLSPLMPYVKTELKKKNNEELKEIISSSKARVKMIGSIIVNNKDAIIESVTSKYKFAKAFIEMVIQYIKDNEDSINKITG